MPVVGPASGSILDTTRPRRSYVSVQAGPDVPWRTMFWLPWPSKPYVSTDVVPPATVNRCVNGSAGSVTTGRVR